MQQIYLDNNSTTTIDPAVAETMAECLAAGFVNPASQHQMGQAARRALEDSRTAILQLIGATPTSMEADQLIFTSGGTESNNLGLLGLSHQPDGSLPECRRVLVSSIEHPSISVAADLLQQQGWTVERIRVDSDGVIYLDHLDELLDQPARLVSVMAANNETGVIQPVAQIAERCQKAKALFHCDAVQALGKIPLDFYDVGCDAMTITAHKLHGPRGIGALVLRNGLTPFPAFFGGFQQQGIRPGTEDVCLARGFSKAVELAVSDLKKRARHMRTLRDRLQKELCEKCTGVTVNGGDADRTPHTLNLSFSGINRQEFLLAADMNGLAVSTGSACASGSSDPSPVLLAMGLGSDVVEGSIRISFSARSTPVEMIRASDCIVNLVNNLRR